MFSMAKSLPQVFDNEYLSWYKPLPCVFDYEYLSWYKYLAIELLLINIFLDINLYLELFMMNILPGYSFLVQVTLLMSDSASHTDFLVGVYPRCIYQGPANL